MNLLRGYRKTLYDYIRWGTLRGGPDYLERRLDDRLLETISGQREVLEEIHRVSIAFVDEDVASRRPSANVGEVSNRIQGGNFNTVVQAGSIAEVIIGTRDDFDPRTDSPLIVTSEVLPGFLHADPVVDGDPPEAVTPSGSIFVINIQSRSPGVIVQQARAKVRSRRPPRRACLNVRITGVLTPPALRSRLRRHYPPSWWLKVFHFPSRWAQTIPSSSGCRP